MSRLKTELLRLAGEWPPERTAIRKHLDAIGRAAAPAPDGSFHRRPPSWRPNKPRPPFESIESADSVPATLEPVTRPRQREPVGSASPGAYVAKTKRGSADNLTNPLGRYPASEPLAPGARGRTHSRTDVGVLRWEAAAVTGKPLLCCRCLRGVRN